MVMKKRKKKKDLGHLVIFIMHNLSIVFFLQECPFHASGMLSTRMKSVVKCVEEKF